VVGKLRTHEDKKVADLAKETVKKWKNDVAGQKDKAAPAAPSTTTTKAGEPVQTATSPVIPTKVASGSGTATPMNGVKTNDAEEKKARDATSDGISGYSVNDRTRDSSIVLLYNAICLDSTESTSHLTLPPKPPIIPIPRLSFTPVSLSQGTNNVATAHILSKTKSLEAHLYKQSNSLPSKPNPGYRTKIRSLYQNLKSNPSLRTNLLSNVLSIERLSTMTSAEMASDERKEENQKLQEQNIFNAKGAAPKNATTNEFMCGKCKQRKVSYYQMQTRSADEPMTSMAPFFGGWG
jgi:transcription elongation factor S-II